MARVLSEIHQQSCAYSFSITLRIMTNFASDLFGVIRRHTAARTKPFQTDDLERKRNAV